MNKPATLEGPTQIIDPEPPRPLYRATDEPGQFPIDALGGKLTAAAKAIANLSQVPDAVAANSVLAVAALATQAHANFFHPAEHAAKPISLTIFSVLSSSERKSSADKKAMKEVWQFETELRDLREDEHRTYRAKKKAYDAALANISKGNGRIDVRAVEDAVLELGDPPEIPMEAKIVIEDATVEGIEKAFLHGRPSLGLFNDEGGLFVGGYAMKPENRLRTSAFLSKRWDGAPISRSRGTAGESFYLYNRRLSSHMMMQPGVARMLLADEVLGEQGLTSRVLVCEPVSLVGTRMQVAAKPEWFRALDAYYERIGDAIRKPPPLRAGSKDELDPRALALSQKAERYFLKYCDLTEAEQAEERTYQPIRSFAGKMPEHAGRIASVLTLAEDPEAGEITLETLIRAIEIVNFYASEWLRLGNDSGTPQYLIEAEKVFHWLVTKWKGVVHLAAIYQRGPRPIRTQAQAKSVVSTLEEHGRLIRLDGPVQIEGITYHEAWKIVGKGA